MPTDERMASHTDVAELILYATPVGELARACREYWRQADEAGRSTVAQTYPPHCTLTGFFHRPLVRVDDVAADVARAVPDPVIPAGAIHATFQTSHDWVGFALASPVLDHVVDRFVAEHRVESGEDALRPKSCLHLSLAYGDGLDVDWHATLAGELVPGAASPWTVSLWRRHADGRWSQLNKH